jgi:hypothetical protein
MQTEASPSSVFPWIPMAGSPSVPGSWKKIQLHVTGNDDLGKQYGLDSMPLTALIDRDGKIADVHPDIVSRPATDQKLCILLQPSCSTHTP